MSYDPGISGLSGANDVFLNNPLDGQTLVYNSSTHKWGNVAQETSSPIIVAWSTVNGWGTYSSDTSRVRYFQSQNDINATAPTYYSAYDLWFRHPGAA